MRMSFGAKEITNAIVEALNSGDMNVARSLFKKNRKAIELEEPDLYKKLEAELFTKPKVARRKSANNRKTEMAEKTKLLKRTTVRESEKNYRLEISQHLKEGRPIPAYNIYKDKKPLSREDFLKLCEDTLSSGVLKETMNYNHATDALKRIINALKSDSGDDNIFEGVVSGASGEYKVKRKSIKIHPVSEQYPDILFGKLVSSTEQQHVAWFGDYSKYKSTMLRQDFADSSAELKELADDIHYMDREQRLEAIAERYRISRRSDSIRISIENMKLIANSPYFARVDYKYLDKNKNNKIVYISKIKNIEDYPAQRDNVNYADWRAPIGDLFYRSNDNLGKMSFMDDYVDVVLNGRIVIRDGALVRLDANSAESKSDNVGNYILQERLAQSSNKKIGEVVETIQVEQNDIIRHTAGKDLIIQGSAGSGKTIIGIHRIAYLMYSESLKNDSILFVSPNEDFSKYVSDVLPELGEYNMPIVTMSDIINMVLANSSLEAPVTRKGFDDFIENYFDDNIKLDTAPAEDFSSFIERYFENGYEWTIGEKYSHYYDEDFFDAINKLHFNKISLNLDSVMNADNNLVEVKNRKDETAKMYSLRFRISDLSDFCKYENSAFAAVLWAKVNNTVLKLKPGTPGMYTLCCEDDPTRAIATKEAYYRLIDNVKKYKEYTKEAVDEEIKTHRYRLIKKSFYNLRKEIYPTDSHSDVIHIVVDEAQDYSPVHIQLLKTVFPRAHFTILGDENQNLNPYIKNSHLRDLLPGADYIGVRKAYRSSPEIVDYTNRILNENIFAVRESNKIPVTEISINKYSEITRDSLLDNIKSVSNNLFKRVAVICRDKKLKQFFRDKMKGLDEYGVEIGFYTTYEAKGLEFDAVIVIDTYDKREKELLYTACTRAQHQLIVYKQNNNALNRLFSLFRR